MLNNDKVVLMSQLAISEKNDSEDIKLGKYYKSDYVRFNLIKTALSVSIAYICFLLLACLYNAEKIVADAMKLNYTKIGMRIFVGYIILLIVFCIFGLVFYSKKYDKAKTKINKFYRKLSLLSKFYKDEEKLGN